MALGDRSRTWYLGPQAAPPPSAPAPLSPSEGVKRGRHSGEERLCGRKHRDLEMREEMLPFPLCSLAVCAAGACLSVCACMCVEALPPLHSEHSPGSHDDRQGAALSTVIEITCRPRGADTYASEMLTAVSLWPVCPWQT